MEVVHQRMLSSSVSVGLDSGDLFVRVERYSYSNITTCIVQYIDIMMCREVMLEYMC